MADELAAIPDDDSDIAGMSGLELQRERLRTQRAVARAAADQSSRIKNIERYSLVTMIGVLGSGALGVVRDPPHIQQAGAQLAAWILGHWPG
jgi:hypothetical protein